MKSLLSLAVVFLPLLAVAAPAPDDEKPKGKAVESEVYTKYFESNKSGLKGDASYLAITEPEAFAATFGGPGFVMGGDKPKVLPKDAFEKKMVVAVIKRGDAITTYKDVKVTADDETLYVSYDAEAKGGGGSAKFASPLIVSLDKGKYTNVIFFENGKKVGSAKVGK
jgi:hypothetical protein